MSEVRGMMPAFSRSLREHRVMRARQVIMTWIGMVRNASSSSVPEESRSALDSRHCKAMQAIVKRHRICLPKPPRLTVVDSHRQSEAVSKPQTETRNRNTNEYHCAQALMLKLLNFKFLKF